MPIADVLQPGTLLRGKYRVERVLGSGGMGVVVLATHVRMAKLVAIKLLQPETRDRPDVVVRFAREARAASQLRGEHAVRILDVDDGDEGDPFLVMEYLEGSDLHDVLQKEGPLPVETAVTYALQVCEGIAEAHALGIVHRDIKPANLFLTTRADGSPLVKILDFGISKATEAEGDHLVTKPQTAIGSPSYMSPEALKDSTDVDARTDIWSLGIVIHQLLTSTLPFQATSTAALAARIVADAPQALRAVRPDVPAQLEELVLRCLAKSPDGRFADMTELAHALAPLAPGGEAGASRIARVAIASAQRGPSSARTSSPPPSLRVDSRPASTPAPATASLHGVTPSPLQRAMVTEDGSSVVANAPDRPSQAPRGARGYLLAGLFVSLLAASGWWAVARVGSRPPPLALTPPGSLDASPTVETVATTEAPAVPVVVAAASSADAAVARADAGARRVRPSSSALPSSSARPTATKNPMDIDFR